MPLKKGKSRATFSENVREMMHSGHPRAQALAAAYAMKRKSRRSRSRKESFPKKDKHGYY